MLGIKEESSEGDAGEGGTTKHLRGCRPNRLHFRGSVRRRPVQEEAGGAERILTSGGGYKAKVEGNSVQVVQVGRKGACLGDACVLHLLEKRAANLFL